MTQDRIAQKDLDWWLDLAAGVEWIFARTYAESAPHSYVVLGRTAGMTRADYIRAGRVIHTFGRPGKFYGMTSIYLTSPDGALKWWTMDADVSETTLINQATTDRLYGVQNAPVTDSTEVTEYDAIATAYDDIHPWPMAPPITSERPWRASRVSTHLRSSTWDVAPAGCSTSGSLPPIGTPGSIPVSRCLTSSFENTLVLPRSIR